MVVVFAALPALGVNLLTNVLSKIEKILDGVDATLEKTVDLSLLNNTITEIDNLADPLLNNLASGLDALLTQVLGK